MIIEVLDMDDSVTGPAANSIGLWNARTRPGPGRTIIKYYGMSNGVAQMVADIKKATGRSSINVLRIWGHGYPGGQGVSGGVAGATFANDFAGMTVSNVSALSSTLGQLRPLFARGARTELRGCNVAQGNGDQLLVSLARIWGVPVQGGSITQHAGSNWDGPVTEATPAGGLRCVVGTPL
ncbi:MAG: hypothetical protein HYR55_01955 [Acidobacteria bacterium]|nr:hypothetical protein [Acidobacteriota bacterium]MBI3655368.1 hypothetical protein [Acidobacteriota bacterium]